jgi:hypothetical protein
MKRLISLLVTLLLLAVLAVPQGRIGTPTGGGISDFVTETFTEATSTTLASHTGEVGATWTLHPSYGNTVIVDASIDRAYASSTSSTAYYASGTPSSANYYVQVTVTVASLPFTGSAGPAGRMDTTANTQYGFRLRDGTSWQLFKLVTGTLTQLGSESTNNIPTVGQSRTLKLVMTGDQISGYVEGTLEVGPITDMAITAAGKAGIRLANPMDVSTGFHLDNFSAR